MSYNTQHKKPEPIVATPLRDIDWSHVELEGPLEQKWDFKKPNGEVMKGSMDYFEPVYDVNRNAKKPKLSILFENVMCKYGVNIDDTNPRKATISVYPTPEQYQEIIDFYDNPMKKKIFDNKQRLLPRKASQIHSPDGLGLIFKSLAPITPNKKTGGDNPPKITVDFPIQYGKDGHKVDSTMCRVEDSSHDEFPMQGLDGKKFSEFVIDLDKITFYQEKQLVTKGTARLITVATETRPEVTTAKRRREEQEQKPPTTPEAPPAVPVPAKVPTKEEEKVSGPPTQRRLVANGSKPK